MHSGCLCTPRSWGRAKGTRRQSFHGSPASSMVHQRCRRAYWTDLYIPKGLEWISMAVEGVTPTSYLRSSQATNYSTTVDRLIYVSTPPVCADFMGDYVLTTRPSPSREMSAHCCREIKIVNPTGPTRWYAANSTIPRDDCKGQAVPCVASTSLLGGRARSISTRDVQSGAS